MYLLGYTIDNVSLMALTIAVGFIIDDAVVMVENINRHIEEGMPAREAALTGSREIGFTIVSMTLSLVAVFIPLLLMGGLIGRLFREFAVTVSVRDPDVGPGLADTDADDVWPSALPFRRQAAGGPVRVGARDDLPTLARRRMSALVAPPSPIHHGGHGRHACRHRLSVHSDSQGFLSAAGQRIDPGHDGSRP